MKSIVFILTATLLIVCPNLAQSDILPSVIFRGKLFDPYFRVSNSFSLRITKIRPALYVFKLQPGTGDSEKENNFVVIHRTGNKFSGQAVSWRSSCAAPEWSWMCGRQAPPHLTASVLPNRRMVVILQERRLCGDGDGSYSCDRTFIGRLSRSP